MKMTKTDIKCLLYFLTVFLILGLAGTSDIAHLI